MRNLNIDTLRGIACILLVSFHVVGIPDAGLRLPETHPLVRMNEALAYLRMPLFSFISGYVYAMRPLQGDATGFLRGKTRRLLLPVLTLGTLFALLQSFTPGTNGAIDNWWLLHIVPVGHFWFLEALFIIFVILVGLERSGLLAVPGRFAMVFAASLVPFAFSDLPRYFAVSGVVYLLPFFLGGLACYRFAIGSTVMRWLAVALLVGAVVRLWAGPGNTAIASLAGLTVGLASAFLLLRSGWQNRWLAFIGGYSFAIFLMHVFFTAASRLFFTALGLSDPYALLVLGTTAGVVGPIVAALILAHFARLEFLLLGQVSRSARSSHQRNPLGDA
jgi:fucose 4-O-acetylase-like acetyltransferase